MSEMKSTAKTSASVRAGTPEKDRKRVPRGLVRAVPDEKRKPSR